MPKPDVGKIVAEMKSHVDKWHEAKTEVPEFDLTGLECVIMQLCSFNYQLWHEEDEARREDVSDEVVVRVKRAIDGFNQSRNDTIEKVDEVLLSQLTAEGVETPEDARINTETPGSVFDRISISVLRLFHLEEELLRDDADDAHRKKVQDSVERVKLQQADLAEALSLLLDDVFAGKIRLKVYRQFKMYNDPDLNPALYKN